MPERIGRRTFLLGGAAAATVGLTGCNGDEGRTAPTPMTASARPTGVRWATLRRAVAGELLLPGDRGFRAARLTENPRYDDSRPLAVLAAASAADIARAFAFAGEHGIPVQVRSGGHSYPGWSSGGGGGTGQPAALVLDCRGLDGVETDGTTATIGAGASLAAIYQAIGAAGRAIPCGSCATVGIAGLTQGGGVGVLTRDLGLTCDRVRSMQVVLADGSVVTASPDEHDDLFWALCGGGGGHLGAVTSFVFDTVAAPRITAFYLSWPLSAAAKVVPAWQGWIDGADPRLWSTMKALGGARHADGPVLVCAGTWTGPPGALANALRGLLDDTPKPDAHSTATRSYLDTMRSYAGCANLPAARCHTGPGGGLQREAFAATSHVAYEAADAAGVRALVDRVDAVPDSLLEAGISMDALGGRVADIDPEATAFVHRRARFTVQYTATYAGDRAADAAGFVEDLRAAMVPTWGNTAYVNYADASLEDYRSAYWGDNAARLARVRATYDPHRFFTQPQGF